MANSFTAKVDVKTFEFLLDLPTEFSISGLHLENDEVKLTIETDLEVPSQVSLDYQTDEYGNVALIGLKE